MPAPPLSSEQTSLFFTIFFAPICIDRKRFGVTECERYQNVQIYRNKQQSFLFPVSSKSRSFWYQAIYSVRKSISNSYSMKLGDSKSL